MSILGVNVTPKHEDNTSVSTSLHQGASSSICSGSALADVTTTTPQSATLPVRKRNFEEVASDAYNTMQSLRNRTVRDEYQAFGDLVAFKLRKLSSTHAKNKVQLMIHNILYQAEEGHYDMPSTPVQPSTSSEQTCSQDHTNT